jgi:hypothetical protein
MVFPGNVNPRSGPWFRKPKAKLLMNSAINDLEIN